MDYNSLDFTSRKKLLATLEEHVASIGSQLSEIKAASLRVPDNKKKHEGYLIAANLIRGVINGLTEKIMPRTEATKLLKKAYRRIAAVESIEVTAATKKPTPQEDDEFAVEDEIDFEVEKEEGVDTFVKDGSSEKDDTRVATQISNLRLHRKNLPAKITGTYSVAHVPVIPIFRNLAISNPDVLKDAGFKTLHFSGNDLEGYVVLDQQAILIVDYEKYNKQYLAESQEEYDAEIEDYKTAYKDWKAKFSEWESEVLDYEEAIEEYQKELIAYNKKRAAYEKAQKLKEEYPALKEEYQKQLNLFKAGKLKVKPTPPAIIKPMKEPVRPEEPKAPSEEFTLPKPVRPKKPVNADTDSLSDVVNDVLKELAENMNVEYVLMSDIHRRNPKNGELLCFWVAEKWKVRNLDRKFGRVIVDEWGFPF